MDPFKSLFSPCFVCLIGCLAMWFFGPSVVVVASDPLSPSSVPWLFLFLLLGGIVEATRRYRNPCTDAQKKLSQAACDLARSKKERGDSETGPTAEPSGQVPNPFVQAKHVPLSNLWTRFANARGSSTGHPDPDAAPSGTASVGDYFTTESILGKRWDTIPDALPGVFTAVGLLGTFVGIAIGLADIPQGVSGGSPSAEDLRQSIDTLIGGMSTAFSTSIVGITASIWWIFEFRHVRRKLESSLSDFVRVTDQLFPVEEPHDTLMRIASANDKAAEAVGALDGFATLTEDVASVKGGIQTLGQDIHDALEPLVKEYIKEPIENLNVDLGERQTEALGRMVTEFRDTLLSHVGEELERFGEVLKSARAHQSSTVAELDAFFTLLQEVSNTQLQVLDRGASVAATFERGLSAMTESQEAIERASVAARRIMEQAEALVEETGQQLAAQKEAADVLRQSWAAETDTLNNLKEHFLALTSELGDKIIEFRGLAAERIGEVFHSFDSEMGKVTEHLGGTLADLRETTEEFPGIALRLVDVTSSLEETSKAQHESLTQGFDRFENVTAKIAEQLNLGREELVQASGQLPGLVQEIDRVGKRSDRLAESVQQAGSKVSELVQRAKDADRRSEQEIEQLSAAAGAIGAARQSLKTLDRTMSALPQKLSEEIRRQQQAIDKTPSARIDGTSRHGSADGERTPTPGRPRRPAPLAPASNPPAHGERQAAGRGRETTRLTDERETTPKQTKGEFRSHRVRVSPSDGRAAKGPDASPEPPDDPPEKPSPTARPGWFRKFFRRRGQ